MTKYSDELIRAAHARYMEVKDQHQVAAEFGISQATLTTRWRLLGLPTRKPGGNWHKLSPEDVRAAYALYEEGHTMRDVAARFNVTGSALAGRFRNAGLPVRKWLGPFAKQAAAQEKGDTMSRAVPDERVFEVQITKYAYVPVVARSEDEAFDKAREVEARADDPERYEDGSWYYEVWRVADFADGEGKLEADKRQAEQAFQRGEAG